MSFVYPQFLWAFLLIAIPIIIHLFNFRKYKQIHFSNIQFLKEVKEETRSKSQLKHLLILLSRILAISALVLAFAQPYFADKSSEQIVGKKAVSIYLDNSFSMKAENKNGEAFQIAREQAISIIEQHNQTDEFNIITNDLKAYRQRLMSKEQALQMLDELKISSNSRKLSDIVNRQNDILKRSKAPNKNAYLISDCQENAFNVNEVIEDTAVSYTILPIKSERKDNIYIDSIWFESPVRQVNNVEVLKVKVINDSKEDFDDFKVEMNINGALKQANLNVKANSDKVGEIKFSNHTVGTQNCKLYLSDDYPQIKFDDTLYFAYDVAKNIPVLLLNEDGEVNPFNAIFSDDVQFDYASVNYRTFDISTLSNYNLVVINQLKEVSTGISAKLNEFVQAGGSVCFIPNTTVNPNVYNEFLLSLEVDGFNNSKSGNFNVRELNIDDVFYQNVFEKYDKNMNLPSVKKYNQVKSVATSGQEVLMRLNSNDPLLTRYSKGNGKVYVFSTDLNKNNSNLIGHSMFVTAMLRMAELSYVSGQLYYTIGEDNSIELTNKGYNAEVPFHLKDQSGNYDLIPVIDRSKSGKISLVFDSGVEQIENAGFYNLEYENKLIKSVGINYNRLESDMNFVASENEFTDLFASAGLKNFKVILNKDDNSIVNINAQDDTKTYWKWFLILSLIFIGIEILLIRLWKA